MKTIAVLMACYNRRDQTLRCLASLFAQELPAGIELAVYLCDNGTDRTAEAARARFPTVHGFAGSEDLYWTGGTALAWERAREKDFYLWLNDDVVLRPGALMRLWQVYASAGDPNAIAVGCIRNQQTDAVEYGGKRLGSRWAFRFDTVAPESAPARALTFNGNLVLIPETARRRVGELDARLVHCLADYDYGLRAAAAGIPIWVAPGIHGDCDTNSFAGSYRDPALPRLSRWRLIRGPKGLPPRAYWHFIRAYAPNPKLVYWLAPYAKVLLGRKGRTS